MITVRLHGELAEQYGEVWPLHVHSVAEVIQMIEANIPGFARNFKTMGDRGFVFRLICGREKDKGENTQDLGEEDLMVRFEDATTLDIVPMVEGAGPGVRFVIGAILFVVGAFTSVFGGLGVPIAGLGLSLMFGAVTEWLTPKPTNKELQDSGSSYAVDGPTNTSQQGQPYPLVFGECLAGSAVLSSALSIDQTTLMPDNIAITGEVEKACSFRGNTGVGCSNSFNLTIQTNDIQAGVTFLWSIVTPNSGFSITNTTSATVTLGANAVPQSTGQTTVKSALVQCVVSKNGVPQYTRQITVKSSHTHDYNLVYGQPVYG